MLLSRLLVVLFGVAFIASQTNLALILAPLRPSVFALQLAFTVGDFWHIVELWGDSGLAVYRSHFAFDNVHPFIYGAFGYFLVANTPLFLRSHLAVRRAMLFALPVAAAFDLAENAAHLYLLAHQPGFGELLVPLSAICSSFKWGLASVFAVGVAIRVWLTLWANLSFHRACAKSRAGR